MFYSYTCKSSRPHVLQLSIVVLQLSVYKMLSVTLEINITTALVAQTTDVLLVNNNK